MDSYFWFNLFKDVDRDTLIVLFLITFTVYIISTYFKHKLELEDKSDSNDDRK